MVLSLSCRPGMPVAGVYVSVSFIAHDVCRNDLVETAGASQALVLLSNMMFEAGDVVFVEERTYFVALKVLAKDRGMKVVPGVCVCVRVCACVCVRACVCVLWA